MSEQEFNWKAFQKTLNYSDQELEVFKADPKRSAAAKKLFTREIMKKDLIIEIVESHGCSARLKPGDRLVFGALSQLDLERSSKNWCAHAMGPIPGVANMVQDRYVAGLDLNDITYNHFTCGDTGPLRNGWGQVVMKAYVVDRND
jgi:hypothetical protein